MYEYIVAFFEYCILNSQLSTYSKKATVPISTESLVFFIEFKRYLLPDVCISRKRLDGTLLKLLFWIGPFLRLFQGDFHCVMFSFPGFAVSWQRLSTALFTSKLFLKLTQYYYYLTITWNYFQNSFKNAIYKIILVSYRISDVVITRIKILMSNRINFDLKAFRKRNFHRNSGILLK